MQQTLTKFFLVALLFSILPVSVLGNSREYYKAEVTEIKGDSEVEVILLEGAMKNSKYVLKKPANDFDLEVKDKLILEKQDLDAGSTQTQSDARIEAQNQPEGFKFEIVNKYRFTGAIIFLVIVAILLIIFIGYKSLSTLLALSLSFLIINNLTLEWLTEDIYTWWLAPLVAFICGFLILSFNHGINKQTLVSVLNLFVNLILASGLVWLVTLFFGKDMALQNGFANNNLLLSAFILACTGFLQHISYLTTKEVIRLSSESNTSFNWPFFKLALSSVQTYLVANLTQLFFLLLAFSLPFLAKVKFTETIVPLWVGINDSSFILNLIWLCILALNIILALPIGILISSYFYNTAASKKQAKEAQSNGQEKSLMSKFKHFLQPNFENASKPAKHLAANRSQMMPNLLLQAPKEEALGKTVSSSPTSSFNTKDEGESKREEEQREIKEREEQFKLNLQNYKLINKSSKTSPSRPLNPKTASPSALKSDQVIKQKLKEEPLESKVSTTDHLTQSFSSTKTGQTENKDEMLAKKEPQKIENIQKEEFKPSLKQEPGANSVGSLPENAQKPTSLISFSENSTNYTKSKKVML